MYIPASSQTTRGFSPALPFYHSPLRSLRFYLFRFYRFYHLYPLAPQFTNFTIYHFTLFTICRFYHFTIFRYIALNGVTLFPRALDPDPDLPFTALPILPFYRAALAAPNLPILPFYHFTGFITVPILPFFIFYHYFLLRARRPTINPGRGLCILY